MTTHDHRCDLAYLVTINANFTRVLERLRSVGEREAAHKHAALARVRQVCVRPLETRVRSIVRGDTCQSDSDRMARSMG